MADPTLDQRTPTVRLKYENDATRNYNWEKIDDQFRQLLAFLGNVGGGMMPVTAIPITATDQALVLSTATVVATITPDASAANHTLLLLGTICVVAGSNAAGVLWDLKVEVGPAGAAGYIQTLAASVLVPRSGSGAGILPLTIPIATAFDIPMTPLPITVTLTKLTGSDAEATIVVGQGHLIAVVL